MSRLETHYQRNRRQMVSGESTESISTENLLLENIKKILSSASSYHFSNLLRIRDVQRARGKSYIRDRYRDGFPKGMAFDVFSRNRRGMNRRKEISYDESTDVCEEKGNAGEIYPFAFVLRMRVTQIVCGIATLLMGSVALIEEKSHFNMGMGIPAGISTVLAAGRCYLRSTYASTENNKIFLAANSIYCSRGFDGYQPPSCKTQPWTKFRFLGPTVRIAGVHIILWGLATGLLVTVSVNAIRILLTGMLTLIVRSKAFNSIKD